MSESCYSCTRRSPEGTCSAGRTVSNEGTVDCIDYMDDEDQKLLDGMDEEDTRCGTCRWMKHQSCKRHAPTRFKEEFPHDAIWPRVGFYDEECGDYERKKP